MRYKNGLKKSLRMYFFGLFSIIFILVVIASSNKINTVVTSNINTVKSIESSRIIYDELFLEEKEPEILNVFSVEEIRFNSGKLMQFIGTLTGYGPDCEGCIGIVACPPNPNVLNNNIYFNDKDYGTIRILAADPSIPCGSIVRISNLYEEDVIGIVLDRGRDIHGMTMDLLFDSEKSTINFERKYNILFKIERWGF